MYFPHAFLKSFQPSTVTGVTLTTATLGTSTGRVLPLSAATNIVTGQSVSGTGIQAGTVVTGISGSNITISLPINALIASGTTITFGGGTATPNTTAALNAPNVLQFSATTGVSVGMSVTGTSIPAGTTVTNVTSTLVTLSNSVTATITTAPIVFGTSVPTLVLGTTGGTSALTAGQMGFFNTSGTSVQAVSTKPFILAQGSWFKSTSDKIGPFHGGYQESVKSKVINPKYISRVIKIASVTAANQVRFVEVCNLKCDDTYRLRIDLKGSPALRFLSHNIYRTLDAYTGCCVDPDVQTIVDPTVATILWAKQIVQNPITSQFLKLTVRDWNNVTVATQASTSQADIATFVAALDAYSSSFDPTSAGASTAKSRLTFTVAYLDTKFGICTFTPTDKYDLEPIRIYTSMTDESGDPCNVQCFEQGETQAPVQAQGVGETVLRDLILAGRYRQEAYPDSSRVESLRMREIEQNPGLANIDRNGYYDQVLILHNVPRFNNPTSTFDNDQYLIKLWVPTGVDTTAITNYVVQSANLAQGADAITLETY